MDHETSPGKNAPQAEHIHFLFDPGTAVAALAEQRRRFGATVATLSVDELRCPSRCVGWTVADVLRHLVWADATMRRLWSGDTSPAQGFDPRTTPNESVRADRAIPDEVIQQRYLSSTETMIAEMKSADTEQFGCPSLSPAGPVPWWLSAVHLGWDSTVHERDVLTPLGRTVDIVHDETTLGLAYSLVLASMFSGRGPLNVYLDRVRLRRGGGLITAWEVSSDPPKIRALDGPSADSTTALTGDPVAAIDGLCGRGSLSTALSGDEAVIDQLGGLARFFTSRP